MEDEQDQLQHQVPNQSYGDSLSPPSDFIACPIQAMEHVVATVSGYHGSERFNLIKLISHAGANYVGSMSKSITHLVCWKFEGKKYDLALKLNTIIVNHRWIEDCIKQGRRVPEDSYILQSGHEVGPLLLEVPPSVQASTLKKDKVLSARSDNICSKRQITEFSSETFGNPVWEDCCLMNKDEESSSYPSRLSRNGKRQISNSKGVANSAGGSRKGRRLLKNNVDEVVLVDPLVLDLNLDGHLSRMHRPDTCGAAPSSLSGGVTNDIILENEEVLDDGSYHQRRTINGTQDGNEQIKDPNNSTSGNSISYIEDPRSTSIHVSSSTEKITDGGHVDHGASLLKSTESSCVICLTDFCSIRGSLPCGHRFCYSCIQTWVDQRISMGKNPICPLCKARIDSIIKFEDAATADQKIYSQTIPCDIPISDICFLSDRELSNYGSESSQVGACTVCRGREPEDLLISCHLCQIRRIHCYCLDPLLLPWTCSHCKDLRMLYYNQSH